MPFSQARYVNEYNKENYKMYQFRVKKSDVELIKFLDGNKDRSKLIIEFLKQESKKRVISLNEIKDICRPLFEKYNIKEAYLFGSYARGEANPNSDIDIYYVEKDDAGLYDDLDLFGELKEALNKEVDLIEKGAVHDEKFFDIIKQDFIKIY